MAAIAGPKGSNAMPKKQAFSEKGTALNHMSSLRDAGGATGSFAKKVDKDDSVVSMTMRAEVPGPQDGLIKSSIVGKVGFQATLCHAISARVVIPEL